MRRARTLGIAFAFANEQAPLQAKEPAPFDLFDMSEEDFRRIASRVCLGSREFRK